MTNRLRQAFEAELLAAAEQEKRGAVGQAWGHLERAHILSQAFMAPHVRVHWRMLAFAWRRRDLMEVAGQFPRLLLAGPASLLDKTPLGNTGGISMGLFETAPVPPDLAALMQSE